MLRFGNIRDEDSYVMDLVQQSSGKRFIHLRSPSDTPHADAVLCTREYTGDTLRRFGKSRQACEQVVTEDGISFALDPHDVWMTIKEIEYMRWLRANPNEPQVLARWHNGNPPFLLSNEVARSV